MTFATTFNRIHYLSSMRLIFALCALLLFVGCVGVDPIQSDSKPVSHAPWTALLQKHVDEQGKVDYKGFIADSTALNEYLALLSAHHPNDSHWTDDEQLAYWINAYNAFTIQLIMRHYPVASIRDIAGSFPFINSAWDVKFIAIEGQKYHLNNIEHGIIRDQFVEPRIHFALVCAAVACPKLQREAFVPARLDTQLESATIDFLNDATKNHITPERAELSKILDWYGGDFTDVAPSLRAYVNRYSATKLKEDAEIGFMDYDWALNAQD